MAKRYTDSDKWKKQWFRKLNPQHKAFWVYLTDNCNHAGVWDVDFELASFIVGCPLDEQEIRLAFQKQYTELNHGKKWLIKDFVNFQYGDLNPGNRVHASVIAILEKEGAYKGLTRGLQAPKDKDKDKDKDNKGGVGGNWSATMLEFEEIWNEYPRKLGKREALKHFCASVKSPKDLRDIHRALDHYKASVDVQKGFIQHAKTWFNNWRDWVDYEEKMCQKCKDIGKVVNKITGFEGTCTCPAGKRLEKEE